MNNFKIELTAAQVALITDILKPYVELSVSISNQYRAQAVASAKPVKAEKIIEDMPEEKQNG